MRFVSGALHGDLGESFRYERPVLDLIAEALPYTLRLAVLALFISVTISVTLGVLAARYPGSPWDWISGVVAAAAQAAPVFWVGILLSTYFGVVLGILPAGGYQRLLEPDLARTGGVGLDHPDGAPGAA